MKNIFLFITSIIGIVGYSYADLSNPGTKFEGVRVLTVDEKNKCRYQFEVDRGEITRGKKAFFSIGLIRHIMLVYFPLKVPIRLW